MRTQVVSVTSRVPTQTEPYYHYGLWLKSLRRFGVEPTVLGMGEWWGGLMTKPRRLRQWLREGQCTADLLIVSDSYDVVFTAHPDAVGERFGMASEILFNAERGLFPRGDLEHAFRDPGPWKYLNSGLFIGQPANVLKLLEAMNLDDIHDDYISPDLLHGGANRWVHPNDQGHFQYAYAAHPVPMTLDHNCELFQALSACELSEFEVSAKGLRNLAKGTDPLVIHANGNAKDLLLPILMDKWGLTS